MINKIKFLGITALLAVFAFSFISCGGGGTEENSNYNNGNNNTGNTGESSNNDPVIIVGSYKAGSKSVACYWENGIRKDLQTNSGNRAAADNLEIWTASSGDVAVAGMDIYIPGFDLIDNRSNGEWESAAFYWKNGIKIYLDDSNAMASGIAVVGTDVYVSGNIIDYLEFPETGGFSFATNKACYWKNGVRIDLYDDTKYESTHGIFVTGTDVYVQGVSDGHACYWKNNERTYLDAPYTSVAEVITIVGEDVYIGGSILQFNDPLPLNTAACYWKNGIRTDLGPLNANLNSITGIAVTETDIYIAGYYYDRVEKYYEAFYWKNGVRADLGQEHYARINDIIIVGEDVYMVGEYFSVYTTVACYWKNGDRIDLPGGYGAEANGIAIKNF